MEFICIAAFGGICFLAVYLSKNAEVQKDWKRLSKEDLVEVHFVNSKGIKRSLKVARHSARLKGDFVIAVMETGLTINLNKSRILNPEVLGLPENPQNKDEVVSRDCPQCSNGYIRPWNNQYRCWNCGHVLSPQEATRITGSSMEPEPEPLPPVLEEEVEPPILHPRALILGDSSGPELLYVRRDGNRGVIYFEPSSVEIIGNRVNLNPKGIDERYAIALDQVLNPEILTPEWRTQLQVISAPPKPEPIASTYEEGTRIILDEIPLDSFEAVQVMRRIKPELGPFEIFDAFARERETLLQGHEGERALAIGEELEAAGCTVSLQTVGHETGTAIAEPPPQPEVQEEPELPFVQPIPQTGRSPTKDEFLQIRSATEYRFVEIKKLIESAPIDVNARDKHSKPLVFGVRSTKMLGLLMDRGADIHATDKFQQNALHYSSSLKPNVCEMLIQFGIAIDAVSQVGGETPLIRAASMGNYKIAKILIEHGADIHLKSGSGDTALDVALNNNWKDSDDPGHVGPAKGCEKIAALLRRHGAT